MSKYVANDVTILTSDSDKMLRSKIAHVIIDSSKSKFKETPI